jgi:hypothetical protein
MSSPTELDGFDERSVLTIALVYSGREYDDVMRAALALCRARGVDNLSDLFKKMVEDANDPR